MAETERSGELREALRDARRLAYPFSLSPVQRDRIISRIDALLAATPPDTDPSGLDVELREAAKSVDALWDDPDPQTGDAHDGLIWMTQDEDAMAVALRVLRAALATPSDISSNDRLASLEANVRYHEQAIGRLGGYADDIQQNASGVVEAAWEALAGEWTFGARSHADTVIARHRRIIEAAIHESRALRASDTPGLREARLDFIAQAERIRSEHEATHGEAEMCGAECIVLGLATFEDTDPSGLGDVDRLWVRMRDEYAASLAKQSYNQPLVAADKFIARHRDRIEAAIRASRAGGGLDPETLRTYFRHRGWSIVMDGSVERQPFDPFVELAAYAKDTGSS